jgi:hypothetical protein
MQGKCELFVHWNRSINTNGTNPFEKAGGQSMMSKIWRGFIITTAVLMVLVVLRGVSFAEQYVSCPHGEVRAEITSQLPAGWYQTPQEGKFVRSQVGNIGGTKTLMCGYRLYGTTVFLMRPFPENFSACTPFKSGFQCK